MCAHRAVDHDGLGGKNGNQASWPAATAAVQCVNDGNIFKECTKPENLQAFIAQQIHLRFTKPYRHREIMHFNTPQC